MAEGKATIIQIIRPDTFTPGVEFDIRPRMRNDGAEDIFWVRLTDVATGKVLKETTRTTLEEPTGLWTSPMYLTRTQITTFHAKIQFGHLENNTKVVDDTEYFYIFMSMVPWPPPVRYLLTITTTPGNCRVELYDDSNDFIFYVITASNGFTDPILFKEGTYTIKVTKAGYNDYSTTFNLNMDRVLRITLTEPDVWDWIINFVLTGFENLLGWQHGSLLTMLANVKDLITNFFGDIADFFSDSIGFIIDVISDNVGSIFDWLSDQFFSFIDWIVEIGGDIAGFVSDKISDVVDFVTTAFTDFTDWLNEIGGSVADYIGGAIGDFVDWSADQLGGIWTGVTGFFIDAISGFVEAFFGGVDTGIEQAKTSPLHSDEPIRNPVLKGLQRVVREHRKKYNRDEITGEKNHGNV